MDTDMESRGRFVELIQERYPMAAYAMVETSDQNYYGFTLMALYSGDGFPLQVSTEVADLAYDILCDVAWDGAMGEDEHGYARVEIRSAVKPDVQIRTLADLRRAVVVGRVVTVSEHRYGDLNGRREVLRVQTQAFTLSLPDGHPRKAATDAEGGSWCDFPKASDCVFDGSNVVRLPLCVFTFEPLP